MSNHPTHGRVNAETVILLVLIGVFLLGTAASYYVGSPILTALCAAMTATALLYRFLGGVRGSTFRLAAIRFSGSGAVLLGVTWFVNNQLVEQNPIVDPNPQSWIAIGKTGVPTAVKIGRKENVPDSLFLNAVTWGAILEFGNIRVLSPENHGLAKMELQSLSNLGFFNHVEIEMLTGRGIRFTGELSIGEQDDLSPYPYTIRTERFVNSYNGYSILDTNQVLIEDGLLRSKDFRFFKHEDKHFLIFVSRAIHNDAENEPWAVFGFTELKLATDLVAPHKR